MVSHANLDPVSVAGFNTPASCSAAGVPVTMSPTEPVDQAQGVRKSGSVSPNEEVRAEAAGVAAATMIGGPRADGRSVVHTNGVIGRIEPGEARLQSSQPPHTEQSGV